jgi:hypothetical protein
VISAESVVCHAVVPAKAGFPKVFYIFRLSFPRIPVSTSMIGVKARSRREIKLGQEKTKESERRYQYFQTYSINHSKPEAKK